MMGINIAKSGHEFETVTLAGAAAVTRVAVHVPFILYR